jgi:hypothetical protein
LRAADPRYDPTCSRPLSCISLPSVVQSSTLEMVTVTMLSAAQRCVTVRWNVLSCPERCDISRIGIHPENIHIQERVSLRPPSLTIIDSDLLFITATCPIHSQSLLQLILQHGNLPKGNHCTSVSMSAGHDASWQPTSGVVLAEHG